MKKILFCAAVLAATASAAFAQKYDELGRTPQMGWSSWNCFGCGINEQQIHEIADIMVEKGLLAAGYQYLNIDDGWHAKERDAMGFVQEDRDKFPSGLKALGDYIHSKGLKFGIYSDAGTMTCACYPGSLGHEYQDALTYASWGVDYLKYDWCHTQDINSIGAYRLMSNALRAAGRPVFFSMCEWGSTGPWEWAANIGHSWRITGDICPSFNVPVIYDEGTFSWKAPSVIDIIDFEVDNNLRIYSGPGHWNDPDMMQVGNGMSIAEDRLHFSMWCMLAAPLLLGNDLRTMSDETLAIITNRKAISVNQDPLGVQALRLKREGDVEYWFKPLSDGNWAFCLLNRGEAAVDCPIVWNDLSFTDEFSGCSTSFESVSYEIDDVWADPAHTPKKLPRTGKKNMKVTVQPHDVRMFILTRL